MLLGQYNEDQREDQRRGRWAERATNARRDEELDDRSVTRSVTSLIQSNMPDYCPAIYSASKAQRSGTATQLPTAAVLASQSNIQCRVHMIYDLHIHTYTHTHHHKLVCTNV